MAGWSLASSTVLLVIERACVEEKAVRRRRGWLVRHGEEQNDAHACVGGESCALMTAVYARSVCGKPLSFSVYGKSPWMYSTRDGWRFSNSVTRREFQVNVFFFFFIRLDC